MLYLPHPGRANLSGTEKKPAFCRVGFGYRGRDGVRYSFRAGKSVAGCLGQASCPLWFQVRRSEGLPRCARNDRIESVSIRVNPCRDPLLSGLGVSA